MIPVLTSLILTTCLAEVVTPLAAVAWAVASTPKFVSATNLLFKFNS